MAARPHPEETACEHGRRHERLEHLNERHGQVRVRGVAEPKRSREEGACHDTKGGGTERAVGLLVSKVSRTRCRGPLRLVSSRLREWHRQSAGAHGPSAAAVPRQSGHLGDASPIGRTLLMNVCLVIFTPATIPLRTCSEHVAREVVVSPRCLPIRCSSKYRRGA